MAGAGAARAHLATRAGAANDLHDNGELRWLILHAHGQPQPREQAAPAAAADAAACNL